MNGMTEMEECHYVSGTWFKDHTMEEKIESYKENGWRHILVNGINMFIDPYGEFADMYFAGNLFYRVEIRTEKP